MARVLLALMVLGSLGWAVSWQPLRPQPSARSDRHELDRFVEEVARRTPPHASIFFILPPESPDAAISPHRSGLRPKQNGLVAAALPVAILVWPALFATRSVLYDLTNWLISRREFYFIWGYKARLIFASGSVPWSFLQSLPNDFTPRAYPLLVPLQFAVPSILARAWQPQAAGIVETLLAAAALAIAWHELPPRVASIGTLALAGCALLPWPGFADGPLTAYLASAALLLRSKRCDPLSAVLLALAAMTNDEGIAFVAGAAIAVVLTDPKRWRTFIFPVAVVVIWLFSQ